MTGAQASYLSDAMASDDLFGNLISAVDCHLFVLLLWSKENEIDVPDRLSAYRNRMMARPAVNEARRTRISVDQFKALVCITQYRRGG